MMQVSSGIGGSAATIVFATWHRRFGSAINRLTSAVFGVSYNEQPLFCVHRESEQNALSLHTHHVELKRKHYKKVMLSLYQH